MILLIVNKIQKLFNMKTCSIFTLVLNKHFKNMGS